MSSARHNMREAEPSWLRDPRAPRRMMEKQPDRLIAVSLAASWIALGAAMIAVAGALVQTIGAAP